MSEQRITTILWRGKYLILVSLAVAIALALFVTARSAKVYQASALLQVTAAPSPGSANSDVLSQQMASQSLAQTYATLLESRSFFEAVRPQVERGKLSASELDSRISASAVKDTSLISLHAEGPSPASARYLLSSVANAFLATVAKSSSGLSTQQQAEIEAQISRLSQQIQRVSRRGGAAAETVASLRLARQALTQQLAGFVASGIQQGRSVTLAAPATASSAPIRPRPVLNVLAGIAIGLLVGFGLAYLRVRLDRGLHNSVEAEELLDVPVLASIPIRKQYAPDDPVLGEAYDVLRANLTFLSLDRELRMLTFTSYNPREGKTSTVEGLAYAAARAGINVLLVDADVRTRTLSDRLDHADAPGLTNAVVGLESVDDVVVPLAANLTLLTAGPTPPNPASLLSSGRMREVMEQLRDRYQLVLIDAPPVAHLADASILASFSDGVVVVARVGITLRSDLAGVVQNLRQTPTPIVGGVVLEQRAIDQTYYPPRAPNAPVMADTVDTF